MHVRTVTARPFHWSLTHALCVTLIASLAGPAGWVLAADWPGWRGPTGVGVAEDKDLPLTWNAKTGENVVWKVKTGAEHFSSPIVVGGKVILTIAPPGEPRTDDPKKKLPKQQVVCFSADDGKEQWRTPVDMGPVVVEPGYPAATPTPASDGRQVFAWFGSGVAVALDLDGKVQWRKEFPGPYYLNPGVCSSPVLYEDTVLILCDQSKDNGFLVALDKKTGDEKWRQKRPNCRTTTARRC